MSTISIPFYCTQKLISYCIILVTHYINNNSADSWTIWVWTAGSTYRRIFFNWHTVQIHIVQESTWTTWLGIRVCGGPTYTWMFVQRLGPLMPTLFRVNFNSKQEKMHSPKCKQRKYIWANQADVHHCVKIYLCLFLWDIHFF